MNNLLSNEDVVMIGIEKEKIRRDFYAMVAERFEDEAMKKLFTQLRDWESVHIQKFTRILENLEPLPRKQSYPGEMEAYMQSLIDDRFYSDVSPEMFSQQVKTPLDAVNYGIVFEKDAILFFLEMARYVLLDKKEVMMELMEEERSHVIHLVKLRKKLTNA